MSPYAALEEVLGRGDALIGNSGVLRITPTMSLNTNLHIAPLHIAGRYILANVALRLSETGYMKVPKQFGILSFFDYVPENLSQCITESTSGVFFSAHKPTTDI